MAFLVLSRGVRGLDSNDGWAFPKFLRTCLSRHVTVIGLLLFWDNKEVRQGQFYFLAQDVVRTMFSLRRGH